MRVLYPDRIGILSVGFYGGKKSVEPGEKIPQSMARTVIEPGPH